MYNIYTIFYIFILLLFYVIFLFLFALKERIYTKLATTTFSSALRTK